VKFKNLKMRFLIKILLIFISIPLFGQPKPIKPIVISENDPEAEKILNSFNSKYQKLKSYSFDFSVHISDLEAKTKESYNGVYKNKGAKFFLKLKDLDVFTNGKMYYSANYKSKEVQIQDYNQNLKKDLPFEQINNYKKKYKYRVKEVLDKNRKVIELVPLNKNNPIFKIDVAIQTQSNQLKSIKVYEKSGYRILYTISKLKENEKISDAEFDFNSKNYSDFEILDL
jgi:outer membrane lipoprotein-sorting protein